mmetsp:Transcript_30154/g.88181  ORF Transcript_30154/g.88181 Transcript_30154/m.88181 type:complete len:213 (+) Transcript_30154:3842-4480(+)
MALVDTSRGCSTFRSYISLTTPFFTLIPAPLTPSVACMRRSSVTISMGFIPAFSASVKGTTSSASAKALMQYESIPVIPMAASLRRRLASTSGAPPPAMRARFLTRLRTTHCASWMERLASLRTRSFEPRRRTVMVLPGFWTPVNLTTLWPLPGMTTSPTCSAAPSLSAAMESAWATGVQPRVRQMNSTSVRSMSVTTRMPILARKWRLSSL